MSNQKKGQLRWLYLAVIVFGLDVMTKHLVQQYLTPYQPVVMIPHVFNLMLSFNAGAAFSFLSQAGGWQRWLFCGIALAISVGIVIWLSKLSTKERGLAVGLTLILGGALGNLYERAAYGVVTDFLDFYYKTYHWPTFNIADSAICIGAIIVVLTGLRGKKK